MLNLWQKIVIALAFVVVLFTASFLFAAEYQICAPNEYTAAKECSQYHLGPFVIFWIVRVLDAHNGLVTAIATVFVAGFTWTLWLTSKKQGNLAQQSIDLARDEFISTHRPRLKVRRIFSVEAQDLTDMNMPFMPGQELNASLEIVNIGGSKATVISNLSSYRIYFGKEDYSLVDVHAAGRRLAAMEIDLERGARISFELVDRVPDDIAMGGMLIRPSFEPNAEWKMYVMGEVRYRDSMGTVRYLGFCRQLIRDRFRVIEDADYEYED